MLIEYLILESRLLELVELVMGLETRLVELVMGLVTELAKRLGKAGVMELVMGLAMELAMRASRQVTELGMKLGTDLGLFLSKAHVKTRMKHLVSRLMMSLH